MRKHAYITLIATAAVLALSGCGGPTKKGLEARSAAKERIHMVNAQVSYDQARRSFETGDLERALREINNAIDRYPQVGDYHLLKGRVLLELHRLEAAAESFLVIVADAGERVDGAESDGGEGGESTLVIAASDETRAQAHYFAGIVYQRWSNDQKAFEHYHAAYELDQSSVQYLLAAAESLVGLSEYAAARSLIEPRLAYHEHNAALRHLLGQITMLEGDADRAAELLGEARLLNPDDPLLLEELAQAQFEAGRFAETLDSIQHLYLLTPPQRAAGHRPSAIGHRADIRHLEARTLVRLGRLVDARRIYVELSDRVPNDPDVWIELGAVALELGDVRRVDISSTRAMSLAPRRYEGYLLRAILERDWENYDVAKRLFSEAINRSPENVTAHLLLGKMLEDTGELREAMSAYSQALAVNPDHREANRRFKRLARQMELSAVPAGRGRPD